MDLPGPSPDFIFFKNYGIWLNRDSFFFVNKPMLVEKRS